MRDTSDPGPSDSQTVQGPGGPCDYSRAWNRLEIGSLTSSFAGSSRCQIFIRLGINFPQEDQRLSVVVIVCQHEVIKNNFKLYYLYWCKIKSRKGYIYCFLIAYPKKRFHLSTRTTPLCVEVDYYQLIFVFGTFQKISVFLLLKYKKND